MRLTRLLRLLRLLQRQVAYLDSEKLRSSADIKTQSLGFVVVAAIWVPIWCHHTSSGSPQLACNLQSQSQQQQSLSISPSLFFVSNSVSIVHSDKIDGNANANYTILIIVFS